MCLKKKQSDRKNPSENLHTEHRKTCSPALLTREGGTIPHFTTLKSKDLRRWADSSLNLKIISASAFVCSQTFLSVVCCSSVYKAQPLLKTEGRGFFFNKTFKLSKMQVGAHLGKGSFPPFAAGVAAVPPTSAGAPGAQVRQGEGVSQKANRGIFSLSRGLDFGSLQTIQIWLSSSLAGL